MPLSTMPSSLESTEERAEALARIAHFGQVNQKNGEDYITHPERVAMYANMILSDFAHLFEESEVDQVREEVTAIAWLHDVLEDTWVTEGVLRAMNFSENVVHGVHRLTRGRESAEEYYRWITKCPMALVVKVADLIDNTDPGRMMALDPETRIRLTAKYQRAARSLGVSEYLGDYATGHKFYASAVTS